jgi:hypothetical protein
MLTIWFLPRKCIALPMRAADREDNIEYGEIANSKTPVENDILSELVI